MSATNQIMLFAGTANRPLWEAVATYLETSLGSASITTFADGEISVRIGQSVRGQNVFVLQSLCRPVNDRLMELLIMVDALKRSSAGSITAVLPYYAYARQDRQDAPRRPITAKLVADLITAAGVDRVMSMDLHAGQIQGFFPVPFEHLRSRPVLLRQVSALAPAQELVIVSPDAGGVERARAYSAKLGTTMAIIDKRRSGPNVAEAMHVIGDVSQRVAVIIDDMIDTAGTMSAAARTLKEAGARDVYAAVTHPVLSGPAVTRINDSVLRKVLVCDTIPLSESAQASPKIEVCSVSTILGEAIKRVHVESSVSSLFG